MALVSAYPLAEPWDVSLETVPSQRLAAEKLELRAPSRAANVSKSRAEFLARSYFPGSDVRESALAAVRDPNVPVVNGRLCWVVSLSLPGGIYHPSAGPRGNTMRLPASYLLVFVDADTGDFVFGDMG